MHAKRLFAILMLAAVATPLFAQRSYQQQPARVVQAPSNVPRTSFFPSTQNSIREVITEDGYRFAPHPTLGPDPDANDSETIEAPSESKAEAKADGSTSDVDKKVASLEETIEEYDEAFEKLEKQIEDLEDVGSDLETLTEDFEEFSGDKTFVHSGSSNSTMKVAGRIHFDYWGFPQNDAGIDELEGGPDGPQARFGFRRVRFGVAGNTKTNMRYKIEMEFAGGNDSEFRDVYVGWTDLPVFHTILVGNQKRPYGLDHLNSSRYNVFLERPFVIESFNQDARRLGIQSYGVSPDQRWNWRYGVFNQRLVQDEGNFTNDNLQLEFAQRIANTFWYDEISGGRGYGHWAFSHTWASPDGLTDGDNGSAGPDQNEARFRHRPEARSASRWLDTGRIAGADEYHLYGLEGVMNFGALQVVTEGQYVNMTRDAGSDLNFWGSYVYASYFLTGEHIPWKRSSGTLDRIKPFEDFFLVNTQEGQAGGWGAWQVAARYSYADFNSDDIFGGIGESGTLGLNWYWNANARLQFNWVHGRIANNAQTTGTPTSGRYDIVGARFGVNF